MNTWVANVKGLVDILLWKRIQRFPVYRNVAALKVKDGMRATSFEKVSDFSRLPNEYLSGSTNHLSIYIANSFGKSVTVLLKNMNKCSKCRISYLLSHNRKENRRLAFFPLPPLWAAQPGQSCRSLLLPALPLLLLPLVPKECEPCAAGAAIQKFLCQVDWEFII